MRLRRFLLLAATLSACTDGTAPLDPGASPPPAGADGAVLASTSAITAVPGFSFAPPIAQRSPAHAGAFDGALAPSVVICELGSAGACTQTVATLTTAGSGDERLRVNVQDELYEVSWSTRGFAADGKTYRVRVLLWAKEIGSLDLRLVATGADLQKIDASRYFAAVAGSTVPIKFRIEEAVLWNGLAPLSLSRASAPPGGALELDGVSTSAGTTLSIGNAPAVVRDGGHGKLLTFAPVFLGASRWSEPPAGPQHVVLLRDGIPIAGAKAALTITPLQKAAGSGRAALQSLTAIAARFDAIAKRFPAGNSADAAYLQAVTGAFAALIGSSDPRSIASQLQQLASTDPGALELLDALMASTGLVRALQQYETLMAGLSVPAAPTSMVSASRAAATSRSPQGRGMASPTAVRTASEPTPTEVTAVELATKMQLYVVVKLFSETVVSGTNSTWANYIAAGSGFVGLVVPLPQFAYVSAALAIADFVANKVIVGQMPARLSTFSLLIDDTQLALGEETISTVTAIGVNDPASMGVQDVTNLFLSVAGAFPSNDEIRTLATQKAEEIANFFLGFLQNLLTVFASQHPELNLDVSLASGPRWAWRAIVIDPRLVDRKTQTPSIIAGVSNAVNWRSSAVNRGEGRVFAQTAFGPEAILVSLPLGFTYTGGAFGEDVMTTNMVDVIVGGRVTVSPSSVTVAPRGTQQFSAAGLGVINTAVTWATSDPGGIVSSSGVYTAGPNPGVFTVTATSVEDPISSDAAQVNVVAPPAGTGVLALTRIDGGAQTQISAEGAPCTQSFFYPTTSPPPASATLQTAQCQAGGGVATATERYASIATSGRMTTFTATGQVTSSSAVNGTLGLGQAYATFDFEVSGGDVSVTLTGQLTANIPDDSSNTAARASFILSERLGARLVDKQVGRSSSSNQTYAKTATLSGTYLLTPGRYRLNVYADGDASAVMRDVNDVPTLIEARGSSNYTFALSVQ